MTDSFPCQQTCPHPRLGRRLHGAGPCARPLLPRRAGDRQYRASLTTFRAATSSVPPTGRMCWSPTWPSGADHPGARWWTRTNGGMFAAALVDAAAPVPGGAAPGWWSRRWPPDRGFRGASPRGMKRASTFAPPAAPASPMTRRRLGVEMAPWTAQCRSTAIAQNFVDKAPTYRSARKVRRPTRASGAPAFALECPSPGLVAPGH